MDGSSERMNKMINQVLCFHVNRQQQGWVQALLRIWFTIMNMVNASTSFSKFQLHLSWSPSVIPLLIPSSLPQNLHSTATQVKDVIAWINIDINETQDNLLMAKTSQARHANLHQGHEITYKVGDRVMLSTFHRWQEYRKKGNKRVAKFFPRWDGLYSKPNLRPQIIPLI